MVELGLEEEAGGGVRGKMGRERVEVVGVAFEVGDCFVGEEGVGGSEAE